MLFINMWMGLREKITDTTLSGNKLFKWYIFNTTLFIEKQFKGDLQPRIFEFTREELDDILKFISFEGTVQLKNDVQKMKLIRSEHDEYCKKGLGKFVYKYLQDTAKAQSTSQLVAILTKLNILVWDGRKKDMKFWLSDCYKDVIERLFL